MCYGQSLALSLRRGRVRACPEVFLRGRACMMEELVKTAEPLKIADPILDIEHLYLYYGSKEALRNISLAHPQEASDGVYRPLGMWEVDPAALFQPHE